MSETQSAERYPGDYYELEKLRIRQQMQEDITSWAKRRFAVMGVLIGVLGLFGLSTVIHQSVRLMTERPIQREVERVVKATDHAREIIFELDKLSEEATEAASQARDAATASKKGLEEYQKALAALKTELRDIERQSDLLEERFGAASKNIKQVAAVIVYTISPVGGHRFRRCLISSQPFYQFRLVVFNRLAEFIGQRPLRRNIAQVIAVNLQLNSSFLEFFEQILCFQRHLPPLVAQRDPLRHLVKHSL